jgi:HAD superfamily hydrolase (TIGR01662 family)
MTLTAAELVASKPHVLLDFDGPVCAMFGIAGDRTIARALVELLGSRGVPVPADLADTTDPFAMLRYSATVPEQLAAVDTEFRRREVEAARTAPPTPGATEAIRALVAAGHTVTIVSNNSTDAVEAYAKVHDLAGLLAGISAREDPNPALLKPSPYLLNHAARAVGAEPSDCVMVGDSSTDIEAARHAGTAVIAYANKPGKRETFASQQPLTIIEHMSALLPS